MFIFTLKKYNYDVCTFKTLSLKKYNQMKNIKFSDLFCEYIGGNRIKYMDISRIMQTFLIFRPGVCIWFENRKEP